MSKVIDSWAQVKSLLRRVILIACLFACLLAVLAFFAAPLSASVLAYDTEQECWDDVGDTHSNTRYTAIYQDEWELILSSDYRFYAIEGSCWMVDPQLRSKVYVNKVIYGSKLTISIVSTYASWAVIGPLEGAAAVQPVRSGTPGAGRIRAGRAATLLCPARRSGWQTG